MWFSGSVIDGVIVGSNRYEAIKNLAISAWQRKDADFATGLLADHSLGAVSRENYQGRLALFYVALCIEKWGTGLQKSNLVNVALVATHWPYNEIFGQYEYKIGNIDQAYKLFREGDIFAKVPFEVPTWSMGSAAYGATSSEVHEINNFQCYNLDLRQDHEGIVVVGLDESYLPFCYTLARSLEHKTDFTLALVVHSARGNGNLEAMVAPLIETLGKSRLIIYFDHADISSFSRQDQKGYFTLLRYILAKNLIDNCNYKRMIIPDVDLVFSSDSLLEDANALAMDVGLLHVQRWPRPWLRFPAPMLVLSNSTAAKEYLNLVAQIAERSIHHTRSKGTGFLWGVDQAALQIAFDFLPSANYKDIIPFFRRNCLLAQDFGKKSNIHDWGR